MGMKFTQIPTDTFEKLQLNAGILVSTFNPATGVASGLLGATTGGVTFADDITFLDFGDDIDNCPKNTLELKQIDEREVTMGGTFVTVDANSAKMLAAAADEASGKITPRDVLKRADFTDLWWIGDYSDVNTGEDAGFLAIHLLNTLNTGGFRIESGDREKGQFAFTFTGHYSISAQDVVPYEIYVKGSAGFSGSINLNAHSIELATGGTYQLSAAVVPSNASVTWTSGSAVASVSSSGLVTAGNSAGNTIIRAAITVDGVTYDDTCTVVVVAGA